MTRTPAAHLECVDAIHRLAGDAHGVTLAALARRLACAPTQAGERVLALQGMGLVDADAAGALRLTADGERVALRLVRRHRVLERFLTDVLALPWERVHEEATRLTPVVADDVVDGLWKLAGQPASCPHGNPIPAADGTMARDETVPLSRLAASQRATVVRVDREDTELLHYLAALGLLPGTALDVEEVGLLGGPLLVRVGSARYALGRKVAARIRVRLA